MTVESTVRDALVAEMLGDIGKLHDAVDSLKEVLPSQTDAIEKRLVGMIGLLQKAGDAYQAQIVAFTSSQVGSIRTQVKADAAEARRSLDRAVTGALMEIERTAKNTMIDPVQQVIHSLEKSTGKNLALCFASSVLGAVMVLSIKAFFN